jgi:hypothetical protein
MGVQGFIWDIGATEPSGEYIFFNANRNENNEFGKVSFF